MIRIPFMLFAKGEKNWHQFYMYLDERKFYHSDTVNVLNSCIFVIWNKIFLVLFRINCTLKKANRLLISIIFLTRYIMYNWPLFWYMVSPASTFLIGLWLLSVLISCLGFIGRSQIYYKITQYSTNLQLAEVSISWHKWGPKTEDCSPVSDVICLMRVQWCS